VRACVCVCVCVFVCPCVCIRAHVLQTHACVFYIISAIRLINWSYRVLFRLHREMHRALSLLPRRTQQLRKTGETGANLRLKYRKEVREGSMLKRELCSPRNKKNGEGKRKPEKTR